MESWAHQLAPPDSFDENNDFYLDESELSP